MYSNNYKIFKYVSLESCHYAIDLDIVSSVGVFSEIGYMFQWNLLLV